LRESQQLFISLRTYEKCIDSLERDMNASGARVSAPPLLSKTVVKQLSCAGLIVARVLGAPSRARRFALALALVARPWTARSPAPGDGHTHEEHPARVRWLRAWSIMLAF